MDKTEFEKQIKPILLDLVNAYKRYNPEGTYLSFGFLDGQCYINNAHWEDGADAEHPLNFRFTVDDDC